MWDAGLPEAFAELPLAGEHLGLVHAVEPVERVGTGAGDQEDPLVSVASIRSTGLSALTLAWSQFGAP